MIDESPIDRYLNELLFHLRGSGTDVLRVIDETRSHLNEATEQAVAQGLDQDSAQKQAVSKFGNAKKLAHDLSGPMPPTMKREAASQMFRAAWHLSVVGFVAIGVSGVVAALFGVLWGKHFVAGDQIGTTYTAARCHQYLALIPHAASCTQAALADHYNETVYYRIAVGILGLIGAGTFVAVYRRRSSLFVSNALIAVVGFGVFSVASIGLLIQGADLLTVQGGASAGSTISGGLVAGVVALIYARPLFRFVRSQLEIAQIPDDSRG